MCAGGSTCIGGYCICEENTQNNGSAQCVPLNNPSIGKHKHRSAVSKHKLHTYCLTSHECQKPALCLEKKCACPDGTTESKDGNCIYQKSIGKY